ncbi:putative membrane-bound mannosyltransferase [Halanaeroarchaeum sp. HSR-CO]|uniref:flippase activity-associated protein Agl23 n=1 Tax=Halanaeroarchaeum sp. HSR-CO TaxID=2866382 RepID=UPI00217E0082|nr:flippase activity-associated protein Agl23 [Halanaeroarchaeum sp. HSR-CO]UWG47597.1 putative membrane-bound mannosyltransferase [Halanaeroarchaeum sp. HSR-CO]
MDVPALNRRRTTIGVLVITLLAIAVRFVGLGSRVFHWDEARVGYWILQYMETGVWSYRPIVHGPFLFHVNDVAFGLFGPTDFVARSVVALVGALLPLSALLFRDRLKRLETLAVAAFLAFNPILLYYSRFMRNDVLVAAFAFVALGSFVRLHDTGRRRYLYAGTGAFALAATTKEIFVVYLAVWVGTVILLLDNRLVAARHRGEPWHSVGTRYRSATTDFLAEWTIPLGIAAVEFLAIVTFFYAPRPDLYQALGAPTQLPAVLQAATVGAWQELWGTWVAGGHEHSYVDYLVEDVRRLGATAVAIVGFGLLGFVIDRYGRRHPRDVVTVGFGWAAAIFVIYPAITDISAAWGLVHTVVPLAIPAAVGLGYVIEQGGGLVRDEDRVGSVIIAVLLLVATVQVGVTAYDTSFDSPQAYDNPLVQYGQPAGEMQATLEDVESIAASNGGTDVLFYGEHFYVANESEPQEGPNWTNRFPLTWYLDRADADLASTKRPGDLDDPPPVVIARASDYSTVNDSLDGYESLTYELTSRGTETVFFIDRSALENSTA